MSIIFYSYANTLVAVTACVIITLDATVTTDASAPILIHSNTGAIVGGVVGGFAGIIILLVVAVLIIVVVKGSC